MPEEQSKIEMHFAKIEKLNVGDRLWTMMHDGCADCGYAWLYVLDPVEVIFLSCNLCRSQPSAYVAKVNDGSTLSVFPGRLFFSKNEAIADIVGQLSEVSAKCISECKRFGNMMDKDND